MNNQIMPTETEERMVGKKKRVRSAIFALEFFTRKSAKIREKSVWKTTTKKVKRRLLPRTL
jgi:hypothetical protein